MTPRKLALLTGIGLLWAAGRAVLRPPGTCLTSVSVPLATLPPALDGLSLLLLTDLHVKSRRSPALSVLDELAGQRPDLLFVGGDIIESARWMPAVARRLAAIEPVHGAFAAWGNHDLFGAPDPGDPDWLRPGARPLAFMRNTLEAAGIRVLSNAAATLTVHGGPLQIVGLGEPNLRVHNVTEAFAGLDVSRFTLVLAHSPDAAFEMDAQRADLIVCGHTHGGQIVPPFAPALSTGTRHRLPRARGLMHIRGRPVYVSAGLGTVGPPWRFNAPPEATLLRLVRPAA